MICSKCGAQIADNSVFCTNCGAPVQQANAQQAYAQQAYAEPGYATYTPPVDSNAESSSIMTLGIVAAATAIIGLPGIIIGGITRGKVNRYLASGGERNPKLKVGSILSKVGLGLGIAFTAIWFIYFIAILSVM